MPAPVIRVAGIQVKAAEPVTLHRGEHAVGHIQEDGIKVACQGKCVRGNRSDGTGNDHHVFAHRLIQATTVIIAEEGLAANLFHTIRNNNPSRAAPSQTAGGNLGDIGREPYRVELMVASHNAGTDLGHAGWHEHLAHRTLAEGIIADALQAGTQSDGRRPAVEQRGVAELHGVGDVKACCTARRARKRQFTNPLDTGTTGNILDAGIVTEHTAIHFGDHIGLATLGYRSGNGQRGLVIDAMSLIVGTIALDDCHLPIGRSTLGHGVGVGGGTRHRVVQRVAVVVFAEVVSRLILATTEHRIPT